MRQDEDDAQYLSMDDEMTARFPLLAPNYSKAMEDDTLTKKGPYSGEEGTLLNLLFVVLEFASHSVGQFPPVDACQVDRQVEERPPCLLQEYEEDCPW